MKKIKLNTAKLQLNKEKITNLTNVEMGQVNGGDSYLPSLSVCGNQSPNYTIPQPTGGPTPPAPMTTDAVCDHIAVTIEITMITRR